MPAKKLLLNKSTVERIQPPREGRAVYLDTKVRGLQLRVTATGEKTFSLYRWADGKPRRVTLGRFPDVTVEQARKKVERLNGEIAQGKGPAPAHASPTVEVLWREYCDKHLKLHAKRPDAAVEAAEWRLKKYLSDWRSRRFNTIRRSDVVALHQKLTTKHGAVTANRVVQLLRTVFNWARRSELIEGENPASGVQMHRETSRTRFLQDAEAPKFFQALEAEKNVDLRHFIWVAILTGARRGDVLSMRWQDVSFESAIWTVPDPKNQEAYTVALADKALAILKERQRDSNSQWVFPNPTGDGPTLDVKTAWGRFRRAWAALEKDHPERKAAIETFRIHDLRRSFGSWLAMQGVSLPLIGKALGHRSLGATAVYARLELTPVRDAVQLATRAMLAAGSRKEGEGHEE